MLQHYGMDDWSSDADLQEGYDPRISDAAQFDFSKKVDIHGVSDEELMAVYEKELGLEDPQADAGQEKAGGFSLEDDLFLPKPVRSSLEQVQLEEESLTEGEDNIQDQFGE